MIKETKRLKSLQEKNKLLIKNPDYLGGLWK